MNTRKYDINLLTNLYLDNNMTAQQIADQLGVTKKAIQHAVNNYGLKKVTKVTFDESKISRECPIFNYFCGLMATDGYIDLNSYRASIRLKSHDSNALSALADHFNISTGIRTYRAGDVSDLTLPSKDLISYLDTNYHIGRQKTFNVSVPDSFYSDDCLKLYVRGVMDGDGSIRKSKTGKVTGRLLCGSELFVDTLLVHLDTKTSTHIKKVTRSGKYYGFELTQGQSQDILNWMYTGHEEFRIERKYKRFI